MMTKNTRYRNGGKLGFTLVELLVASVIAVIIFTLIVRIVSLMLDQAERSIGNISRVSEVDFALDQLEEDLQSLYWLDGTSGMMSLKTPSDGYGNEGWAGVSNDFKASAITIDTSPTVNASAVNPALSEELWGKWGGSMQFFIQNPRKGHRDPGGLYAVGYQIKRIQADGSAGFPRYYLMRSLVSANNTQTSGYAIEGTEYQGGGFSANAYWNSSVLRYPNANHILVSNVVDFGVRAYKHDPFATGGSNWVALFPLALSGNQPLSERPQLIEVMVRILTDEGAELVENVEQGRMQGQWEDIVLQHSKVYVRQILVGSVL